MFETQSLIILLQVMFCISLFSGSLWTQILNSLLIVRAIWCEFSKEKGGWILYDIDFFFIKHQKIFFHLTKKVKNVNI